MSGGVGLSSSQRGEGDNFPSWGEREDKLGGNNHKQGVLARKCLTTCPA